MEENKLKRCSTSSTHAEAADEATYPLQKDKELDDSETEVNNGKKQKQEEETTEKKQECCYKSEEAKGNSHLTLFISGFDTSGSRDEIKSALTKHFSSCGEITRVFVPIFCATGVSIGHALIDLQHTNQALTLDGSDLGGRKLLVTMAESRRVDFQFYPYYQRCESCEASFLAARRKHYRWMMKTRCGKVALLTPESERTSRLLRKKALAALKRKESKSNDT